MSKVIMLFVNCVCYQTHQTHSKQQTHSMQQTHSIAADSFHAVLWENVLVMEEWLVILTCEIWCETKNA